MPTHKQSLSDYFCDAPYFRPFEGLIGAKYYLRRTSSGGGLWFASEPMKLEIVKKKKRDVEYEIIDSFNEFPATREEALKDYDVQIMGIQPGDAIITDFLHLASQRRPIKDFLKDFEKDDTPSHQNEEALIYYRISKEIFRANYELDDVKKCYRQKPYQVKFAPEDIFLETADGIEQIKKYSSVVLERKKLTIHSAPIFSGSDERLVCGQPVRFYRREAFLVLNEEANPFTEIGHVAPGEVSISTRMIDGKLQFPNPYRSLKSQFADSAQLLGRAKILSPEQQSEFDAHIDDVNRRFRYFEEHPVKLP